ncbi:MAG TPA: MmcQ/YjbR family DNA-binding protein, partial [Candidatus Limnocylindrales bacterium]|nr:MmcQ/YjbR family DNA-binding protein [Candidatus Limnocylindrales bacterium]
MNIEWVRKYCLSLPNVSEHVQWEIDLVFKVGGKMFAVMPMEPAPVWLSFKCGPEEFAELVERQGIIPAPYMARAMWVAMEEEGALPRAEVERLLRTARELVFAKLSKKAQAELMGEGKKRKRKTKTKALPQRHRAHR